MTMPDQKRERFDFGNDGEYWGDYTPNDEWTDLQGDGIPEPDNSRGLWSQDQLDTYFDFQDKSGFKSDTYNLDRAAYWQPQQIERYANFFDSQSQTEGWEAPDWVAPDFMQVRSEIQASNAGKPWEEWTIPSEIAAKTANWKVPPIEAVPEYEQSKTNWSATDEAMKAKGYTVVNASTVPEEVRNQYINDQPATTLGSDKFYIPAPQQQQSTYKPTVVDMANEWISGMPAEEYNKLLPVQRALTSLMNQVPNAMTGMIAMNAGKTAAALAAPLGPTASALVGMGTAGMTIIGVNYATEVDENGNIKNQAAFDAYQMLDYLVVNAERLAGLLVQYEPSFGNSGMSAQERMQNLSDVTKGIDIDKGVFGLPVIGGASGAAGSLLFETMLSPTIYDKDNNLVSRSLTSPELTRTKQDKLPLGTIPISDQVAEAMMMNPDYKVNVKDVLGSNPQAKFGANPNATNAETYSQGYRMRVFDDSFINQARQRIAAGENAQDVYNDIAKALGANAPVGELIGQILFDPLDKAPGLTSKGISKVAGMTGKNTAAQAFDMAQGPVEGLRNYGELVRGQLTADQAANLHPVSKWVAGLEATASGQPTQIRGYGNTKNPFDYLFGLDKKSRATQVLNNTADGVNQAIDMVDGVDAMVNQIDVIGSMDAQSMVDGFDKSKLPKWFDSLEAQHIPSMIQNARIKAKELQTQWHLGDRDRQTITKIAEALDIEPHALVSKLHNSKDGKAAEITYREFIDTVAEKAAVENGMDINQFRQDLKKAKTPEELLQVIPDGEASNLLKALLTDQTNGRLTSASLKLMADKFTGENPTYIGLDESLFKARLMAAVETSIGENAVQFFGVKPSNQFMRATQLAKKAQSIVLLGQNPANFVNNTLNNWATLTADMGLRKTFGISADTARAWMDESGIRSSRMGEGAMYTAETSNKPTNPILKATRGDDWVQSGTDKVNAVANAKIGKVNVVTPWSQLSRKAEQAARDVAFTVGAREFLDSYWIPGKGFAKIDNELRMVLDAIQPGLADRYERAVSKSKNIKDIEKMVYSTIEKPSIKDVLSGEEIAQYRKFNAEAFDKLEKAIEDGQPAWKAMSDYKKSIVEAINEARKQGRAEQVQFSMLKSSAEGAKGMSDVMAHNYEIEAKYHIEHNLAMSDLAERAKDMDYQEYSAAYSQMFRETREGWDSIHNNADVEVLGMLRGLKVPDEAEAAAIKTMYDLRMNNAAFFNSRIDLWNEHGIIDWTGRDAERDADVARIQQQLNDEYADMQIEESRLQFQIDNYLREAHVKGARNDLEAKIFGAEWDIWTGERLRVQQKNRQMELLFRTGEIRPDVLAEFGDRLPPELKKEILQARAMKDGKKYYYNEIYPRGLAEMVEVTNKYAPGRVQGSEQTIEAAKPYQEVKKVQSERTQAVNVARAAGIWPFKRLQSSWAKHMGEELPSLEGMTVQRMQEFIAKRNDDQSAPIVNPPREALAQGLKQAMNLTDEQVKARMVFVDSAVKLFAEEKGMTPDEIYGKLQIGDGDGTGMAQTAGATPSEIAEASRMWQEMGVESPYFRRWFGDSKVVDADGKPLVVYHGTGGNFQVFNTGSQLENGVRKDYGAHFGTVGQANAVAQYKVDSSLPKSVMPVYLKIDNPLVLDTDPGDFTPHDIANAIRDSKNQQVSILWDDLEAKIESFQSEYFNGNKEFTPEKYSDLLREYLEEKGFDGIKYLNTKEDIKNPDYSYMILRPEQVKSTFNRGTFDPVDPNILRQNAKGEVDLMPLIRGEGPARISGSINADISTAFHEIDHAFLAIAPDSDIDVVSGWLKSTYGMEMPSGWNKMDYTVDPMVRDAHEKFTRAKERYHREGIAPKGATAKLLKVFDQVKEWMTQIYREIKGSGIDIEISPELRHMLDEWSLGRRVEPDPMQVVAEKAQDLTTVETPEWVDSPKVETQPDPSKKLSRRERAYQEAQNRVEQYIKETEQTGKSTYIPPQLRIEVDGKEYLINISTMTKDIADSPSLNNYISKNAAPLPDPTPEVKAEVAQAREQAKGLLQKNNFYYDSHELLPREIVEVLGGKGIVNAIDDPATQNLYKDRLLQYFSDVKNQFGANSLLQSPEWTPETLRTWAEMLVKKNDPVFLMEAIRAEEASTKMTVLNEVGIRAPELASRVWRAMNETGELYSNKIDSRTKGLLQEAEPGERLPTNSVALGTVDSIMNPPIAKGMDEYYRGEILPMLSRLEQGLRTPQKTLDVNLDPKAQAGLAAWVQKVKQQRADVNLAAIRHGEGKADFALLNYGKQTQADNLANVVFPYQFWYSRSMFNWALRAIDKPKLFADYFRLMNFMNSQTEEREGFPTRLKGKMGMNMPFLPDWMGDVYFDPYKQIYPFLQMARPWTNLITAANREEKKAQTILQELVDAGDLTQQEADEAITTKQGQNWKDAIAQARNELDTDTGNPLDVAQTISGFSMPISIAINMATGRTDRMGMLPATKMLKNLTAAAGVNNYKGVDLSFYGDSYEDARIRTMLANMAANGEYSTDEIKQAMVTKTGPAYTEATRKVAVLNIVKTAIPGMGVDFYPEGEQKARAMDTLYKKEAIPAYEAGDKGAKGAFFDANPALSARYQSYENDPELMLNKYLVGEVWEGYNSLPDLYKKQAREQLGSVFTDWLNPETRSTINDEMLAGWANAMGRIQPKEIDAVSTPIRYADPKIAKKVQDFYDLRKSKFPFYKDIYDMPEEQRTAFYQSKEYKKLKAWSDAFKANNPDIIPWTTNEQDELYGVDPKIAAKVYAYRAEKYGKFGDTASLWDIYNKMPEAGKAAFRKAYPEMDAETTWKNRYLAENPEVIQYVTSKDNQLYGASPQVQQYVYQYRTAKEAQFPGIDENWDSLPWSIKNKYLAWQKKVAAANPEAVSYILSDNTIRKALGEEALPYNPIRMEDMSPELRGQYQDYLYRGIPLTTGGLRELRRIWDSSGKPGGDFTKFVDTLR